MLDIVSAPQTSGQHPTISNYLTDNTALAHATILTVYYSFCAFFGYKFFIIKRLTAAESSMLSNPIKSLTF